MPVRSKSKTDTIKRVKPQESLKKRDMFPMPVCLEDCDLDVTNGFHDEVLKTLKSFSDEADHKRRKPHPVSKSKDLRMYFKKAGDNPVISLDIKGQNGGRGAKRLFYYKKRLEEGTLVCRILALCSEESHPG